jgi:CheY-like chemotaxis protein
MDEKKEIKSNLKQRLLILEDDIVNTQLLLRLLKNLYDMDFVNNGEDALKYAVEKNYDVFLIDIGLPGNMNGIQATKELKKIKDNNNKPFIAMTAFALAGDKNHFLNEGLTHYISKPFEFNKLIELIGSALEKTTVQDTEQTKAKEIFSDKTNL